MVTSAIKDNGDKKISNLNSNENTLSVWNDILNFCLSKKSSHFAINESQTELECLRKQEFSDLIYHRLLHFRTLFAIAFDPRLLVSAFEATPALVNVNVLVSNNLS